MVLTTFVAAGVSEWQESTSAPQIIDVFAGKDRTICFISSLSIVSLNASITGVADGDWIPLGDGRFQPGNLLTVKHVFAKLNNITYVPGVNDKALGFFTLMLLSDAPIGGTPTQKQKDEVLITFQNSPPLFCNSNINISLNEDDTESGLILKVSDDGIGKVPDQKAKGTGFGTQLITLLTRQLDGKLSYEINNGTTVLLYFKKTKLAK